MEFVSTHFVDFDNFRDVLSGWDVEVTQLSRGPLDLTWDQVAFGPSLSLSHLNLNRSVSDRMAIDPSRITFVVCFSTNSFCGLNVNASSMLIFGPGREYRSILPEGFESFEVNASIDFLRAKGLGIAEFGFANFQPENCVVAVDDHTMGLFRRLSNTLSALNADGQDPTSQIEWAAAIRERALSLIVHVLKKSNRQRRLGFAESIPRWALTAKALDLIEDMEADTPPSIEDLSQALDCSSRAIQAAFRSTLGVSPSQYVLARRLQRARHSLLDAEPGSANVTNISADNEFFHFGRFSKYYKLMYGELPSDTLKRKHHLRATVS